MFEVVCLGSVHQQSHVDAVCNGTTPTIAASRYDCFLLSALTHSRPLPFSSKLAQTCRTRRNRTDGLMSPRSNSISTACWHSIHPSPLNHPSSLTLSLSLIVSSLTSDSAQVCFCNQSPVVYIQHLNSPDLKMKYCAKYFNPTPATAILGCMRLCNAAVWPCRHRSLQLHVCVCFFSASWPVGRSTP